MRALAICTGLVPVAASCASTRIHTDAGGRVFATVVHAVDGDTVTVRLGDRTETVRLLGVDTPESVHPRKPVGCFGPEASAHTKQLLPPGTRVWLERDQEGRDRYGRLLAYVHRASDATFVNLELVSDGWAVPYPFEPNITYRSLFADAATAAQRAGLGLWGRCRG